MALPTLGPMSASGGYGPLLRDRALVADRARLFDRGGNEAFEDGVDLSHLLRLEPRYDGGRRPRVGGAVPWRTSAT